MPRIHRTLAALVALIGWLAASAAHAMPDDTLERARQLFATAETDEDAERWADALEKLRTIARVKLTAGVRYHIALCEEHLEQLVRALGDYKAAEDQARTENAKDVLRTVGNKLAALDPRVPRLTIHLDPAVPGALVEVDGEPVPDLGTAMPIDPGAHTVEVRVPERPSWTELVTLQERESRVVDIHFGRPASTTPAIPAKNVAPIAPKTATPYALAIAATATAVVLAGGGTAAFVMSGSEHDRAVSSCALVPTCPGTKDRVRAWDFAAAGMWSGTLVAGAIAVVLWTKPNDAESKVAARLIVGPNELSVEGRF